MYVVWFLLIGLVAGWLAGKITKGAGFGLVGDIVVGVIGAFVGGFFFGWSASRPEVRSGVSSLPPSARSCW